MPQKLSNAAAHVAQTFSTPMASQLRGILAFLLLAVAIYSSTVLTAVEATRRLQPKGQYAEDHHPAQLHERARSLIMAWVAQLTQGPSPRGPGH